ncbi:TrkH family potassium uptake protein [Marivita lacus]|uniref:TrkH family potassium uptake protein n=1 Tax=Marivita lacus TaxID=1323742 RepID=UPI00166E6E2E|nr:TrkH family potassium uptake protein [Marivita lacus]
MSIRPASAFASGADSLAQRARPWVIALTIAKHAPIFVILCGPPAVWAATEEAWALALALFAPSVGALGIFALSTRKALPDDLRRIEALVTVALVMLIGAVLSVPAFIVLGMPAHAALFEAMSGLTTTGHSVATNADNWPFAAHFLRAWLQWCGGLVMATAVLALLLPPGVPTQRLGRAGIDQGDRIASTRVQARQLLTVYVGLTCVMAVATMLAVPDWREGLALTLSAVSTGGFSPRSDSLASYSALGQGIVMLTCVLGSVSLLTFVLLAQQKPFEAWRLGSLRRVMLTLLLLCAVYILILVSSDVTSTGAIYTACLNLISGLTTSGFSTCDIPITGPAMLLFLIAMAVGGDVGSTAGGFKIARFGLLVHAARHALADVRLPRRAVNPLMENRKKIEPDTLISLLALLVLYAATMVLLWLQCLVHGLPAIPALFDIISTLSTVGLSSGVVTADLPPDLIVTLTFAMWLGRLEFIAVLVLLAPTTWLQRS